MDNSARPHATTTADERPPWWWLDDRPTYDEWLDSLDPLDPRR